MDDNYKSKLVFELFSSFKSLLVTRRRSFDLSKKDFISIAIYRLLREKKQVTQSQLVDLLRIPKQTLNCTVADLIDEGLIKSEIDSKDRRQKYLSLTDRGSKRFEKLAESLIEYDKRIFDILGEEKIRDIIEENEKMQEYFEKAKEGIDG